MLEMIDDRSERAVACESTHMQRVNDLFGQRGWFPGLIGPSKRGAIHDLRRSMNAVRLKSRRWIGQELAIQSILVKHTRIGLRILDGIVALLIKAERQFADWLAV